MQHEIELKLAIAEQDMETWRRAPIFRAFARKRSAYKHLYSTYFDTPELSLKALGIALRVRKIGAKRIQTLKVPGNRATGFQHLIEFEQEIRDDVPNLALIHDDSLQSLFAEQELAHRLTPVFTTDIKRRITILGYGESEIEMALDKGRILAGERSMAINEAEFELRFGQPLDILDLVFEIHGRLPFALEHRSKAKRGYGLFLGEVPKPQRAGPVTLNRKMSTREAFSEIAWNCMEQIRANECPVLNAPDPEGVHQLRVGIRRLRSLFGIYRPYLTPETRETIVAELGWAQKQTGPARDWDVFATETLVRVHEAMPEERTLDTLAEAASKMQASKAGDARALVTSERYLHLMLRLFKGLEAGSFLAEENKAAHKALDKSLDNFASRVLADHDRKVRKLASRVEELEIADVHRLRLRVKKMRYAAEFFKEVFADKRPKRRSKALAALQEALGTVNDAAVCELLLGQLIDEAPRSLQMQTASGLVRGWYAALSVDGIASLAALWNTYEATPCFWKR